jgi:hypothetical protein
MRLRVCSGSPAVTSLRAPVVGVSFRLGSWRAGAPVGSVATTVDPSMLGAVDEAVEHAFGYDSVG